MMTENQKKIEAGRLSDLEIDALYDELAFLYALLFTKFEDLGYSDEAIISAITQTVKSRHCWSKEHKDAFRLVNAGVMRASQRLLGKFEVVEIKDV